MYFLVAARQFYLQLLENCHPFYPFVNQILWATITKTTTTTNEQVTLTNSVPYPEPNNLLKTQVKLNLNFSL
jgi:hypothetical protein